jgi:hypothetical protein
LDTRRCSYQRGDKELPTHGEFRNLDSEGWSEESATGGYQVVELLWPKPRRFWRAVRPVLPQPTWVDITNWMGSSGPTRSYLLLDALNGSRRGTKLFELELM